MRTRTKRTYIVTTSNNGRAMRKQQKWTAALKAWEFAHNELMREEHLQPHEREALFCVHELLRTRASGEK